MVEQRWIRSSQREHSTVPEPWNLLYWIALLRLDSRHTVTQLVRLVDVENCRWLPTGIQPVCMCFRFRGVNAYTARKEA